MVIKSITVHDKEWEELIDYAKNCRWVAGNTFAQELENNEFEIWEKIIIATSQKRIVGFCSLSKNEYISSMELTPFIRFIFMETKFRGNRISEKLIMKAVDFAKTNRFKNIYILSSEEGLYEKYGFQVKHIINDENNKPQQIFIKKI